MISIPRDMVDVPFADGRKFRGKINSLVSYARNHPRQFPGSNGKGFDVLMNALGTLLQEPIQYYATVNLGGFVTRRQHARWRQRQRRPRLLRLALQRVRLRERLLDHGRPPPSQRQPGPRLCARPQARRRERLHPGRASAGGRVGHPRLDRQGRLHQRSGRAHQVDRRHGPDERAAQGARPTWPTRPAISAAPRPTGRSSPIRSSGAPTTSAAPSRSPTSPTSARWRRACSRRAGHSRPTASRRPSPSARSAAAA